MLSLPIPANWKIGSWLIVAANLIAACSVQSGSAASPSSSSTQPSGTQAAPRASTAKVDAAQVERLKRIMVPLINAMDHPRPLSQIKVGIMDDPHINAANAGNGEFYVTTGLL